MKRKTRLAAEMLCTAAISLALIAASLNIGAAVPDPGGEVGEEIPCGDGEAVISVSAQPEEEEARLPDAVWIAAAALAVTAVSIVIALASQREQSRSTDTAEDGRI